MEKQIEKTWVILELFGHQRIAGEMQEIQIAGAGFIRITVPPTDNQPIQWTKDLSPSSIYAVNYVDEATAKAMANGLNAIPIQRYEVGEMIRSLGYEKHKSKEIEEFHGDGDDNNDLAF